MQNGKPATQGTYPGCGTKVLQIGEAGLVRITGENNNRY